MTPTPATAVTTAIRATLAVTLTAATAVTTATPLTAEQSHRPGDSGSAQVAKAARLLDQSRQAPNGGTESSRPPTQRLPTRSSDLCGTSTDLSWRGCDVLREWSGKRGLNPT